MTSVDTFFENIYNEISNKSSEQFNCSIFTQSKDCSEKISTKIKNNSEQSDVDNTTIQDSEKISYAKYFKDILNEKTNNVLLNEKIKIYDEIINLRQRDDDINVNKTDKILINLECTRKNYDDLCKKYLQLRKEHNESIIKNKSLSNKYSNLKKKCNELIVKHNELNDKHNELNVKHNMLNVECNKLLKITNDTNKENIILKKNISELLAKNSKLKNKIKNVNSSSSENPFI